MSVASELSTIEGEVSAFWQKIKADVTKAKAVWQIISSTQTRAAMIAVFNAAVKTAEDTAAAVASPLSVTLDAAVVADINNLIAAVKAGDGVISSDFKAIGIVLNPPVPAVVS